MLLICHRLSVALALQPMYMAPEQFNGSRVDEKVDVYALGIILNECFTRRQPWRDSSHFFQIILKVGLHVGQGKGKGMLGGHLLRHRTGQGVRSRRLMVWGQGVRGTVGARRLMVWGAGQGHVVQGASACTAALLFNSVQAVLQSAVGGCRAPF